MKREQVAVYNVTWTSNSKDADITSTVVLQRSWELKNFNFSHFYIKYTITQSDRMWFRFWLRRGLI